MNGDERFMAYWFSRIYSKPWKPGPRTVPKMPRRPWWTAAIACFLVGFAVGVPIFGVTGVGVLRAAALGLGVFAVGMFVIEGRWARRNPAPGTHRGPFVP